jgi:hypothetical protein
MLVLILAVGYLLAGTASKSSAKTGQIVSREVRVKSQGPITSPLLERPPAKKSKARYPIHPIKPKFVTPKDHRFGDEDLKPTSPPTELNFRNDSTALGPETFSIYMDHVFTGAEINSNTGYTAEPSFGSNGRVVFASGNFFASVSGDYGQTFSFVDPYDNFPADGIPDPIDGGFCCDQHVYYERSRGAMFWLLQYYHDGNANRQRLAVANSQDDVLSNTWFWYDFTPAMFGYSNSNHFLDFPDLTVTKDYLYIVTKIHRFRPAFPIPTNIVARIPLDQAVKGVPITVEYIIVELQGVSCTDGAASTMYFGAHVNNTTLRVFSWLNGSPTVSWTDVSHAPYGTDPMVAISPDGYNFAARADDWIWAAWVARGVIGFMWPASQGGAYPYPHVQVLRLDEASQSVLSQQQIWSNNRAWLYPSVHPNDRGHLGGTIAFGGGIDYPGATAWMADDYNSGAIVPLENLVFAIGDAGPSGNRWGDYLATRRNVPYGNTWGGTGHSLIGGPNDEDAVVHYIWFGRERDMPPPNNTIYVDLTNTSGYEDGTSSHPYNTVSEGHFAVVTGDTLIIRAGSYPETVTLSTATTIYNEGGTVTIGE